MYTIVLKDRESGKKEVYTADCRNFEDLDSALELFTLNGYRVVLVEDLSIWEALNGEQEET